MCCNWLDAQADPPTHDLLTKVTPIAVLEFHWEMAGHLLRMVRIDRSDRRIGR